MGVILFFLRSRRMELASFEREGHFDQTWRRFKSKVLLGRPLNLSHCAAYPAGRKHALRIDDLPMPGACIPDGAGRELRPFGIRN